MSLLEVRDLHVSYGRMRVIEGMNLSIAEGQTVVLLGANGSGKTTTLRALSGMADVTGSIRFDGREIAGQPPEKVARAGIGHVPQGRGTMSDLSVEDNLRVGGLRLGRGELHASLKRWFDIFPQLAERRQQMAGSLSGGEQQMVAVARALMGQPRVLLLDEPSLGLAPLVIRSLFETFADINRTLGVTILVVEQNADIALSIADYGYVLEAGRVVSEGTSGKINDDQSVRRAYLGY